MKPPTTLIIANTTAANPSHIPTVPPIVVASTAPIIAIPEIALDTDLEEYEELEELFQLTQGLINYLVIVPIEDL